MPGKAHRAATKSSTLPILSQFFDCALVVLELAQLLLHHAGFGLPLLCLPSGVHHIAFLVVVSILLKSMPNPFPFSLGKI